MTLLLPTLSARCLFGIGAAMLLIAGCSKKPESGELPIVLAQVGDSVITAADFQAEVQRRIEKRQPVPSKEELLDQMVEREALLYRARQIRLAEDGEVERMIENLLIGQLKTRELEPKIQALEATDEEIRRAYESDKDRYTTPAKARLAVLFSSTHEKMTDEKRKALREKIEEGRQKAIANPAPGGRGAAAGGFGALAISYSEDQSSRYRGGDIGWLDVDNYNYRWPRAVLEIGYGLEKGTMSEVIATEKGLYVVMKTDERPALTRSFDDVATSLRQKVAAEKREAMQAAFLHETQSVARVQMHPEALSAIQLPTSPVPTEDLDPEPSLPAFPVSSGTDTVR